MKKIIISIIGIILLIGFVIAQGWNLPNTFTINPNFAGLPTPLPNQTILGCVYAFPITLKNMNVYSYSIQGQNLNINASFSLYTNNKKSACSVKQKVFSIGLLNWQNNIASYIVTNSNSGIRNYTIINNPISTGSSG